MNYEKDKINESKFSNNESVINHFMNQLESNKFVHEMEPSIEKELQLDKRFINEQVKSYDQLLKSSVIEPLTLSKTKK